MTNRVINSKINKNRVICSNVAVHERRTAVEEYKKFLWQLEKGKHYAETFLVKKSSKAAVKKAVEDGVIYEVGKTDVGTPQYVITEKGIRERR